MGQKGYRILKIIGIAFVVAIVGLVFAGYFGSIMNGLPYESSIIVGMVCYTCFVMVVCTGLILIKESKK